MRKLITAILFIVFVILVGCNNQPEYYIIRGEQWMSWEPMTFVFRSDLKKIRYSDKKYIKPFLSQDEIIVYSDLKGYGDRGKRGFDKDNMFIDTTTSIYINGTVDTVYIK